MARKMKSNSTRKRGNRKSQNGGWIPSKSASKLTANNKSKTIRKRRRVR